MIGRLMYDMDSAMMAFLCTKVNSFVKWDLIHFFHENPHTADTAENIARYAGRNAEAVRAELAELAAQGILVRYCVDDMTIYSLSDDPEVKDVIHRFVDASGDWQFRVKAVYHTIRTMRETDSLRRCQLQL
ncbi:MAG: hypothetical protein ACE5OS_08455 [Anaerolineae bacterium]